MKEWDVYGSTEDKNFEVCITHINETHQNVRYDSFKNKVFVSTNQVSLPDMLKYVTTKARLIRTTDGLKVGDKVLYILASREVEVIEIKNEWNVRIKYSDNSMTHRHRYFLSKKKESEKWQPGELFKVVENLRVGDIITLMNTAYGVLAISGDDYMMVYVSGDAPIHQRTRIFTQAELEYSLHVSGKENTSVTVQGWSSVVTEYKNAVGI